MFLFLKFNIYENLSCVKISSQHELTLVYLKALATVQGSGYSF